MQHTGHEHMTGVLHWFDEAGVERYDFSEQLIIQWMPNLSAKEPK